MPTVPVDEAVEAGASRTPVEPDHDGVGGRVALGQHQVVEEAPLATLVHGHVPAGPPAAPQYGESKIHQEEPYQHSSRHM